MYRLPVHFASSLQGNTCFVSRTKNNIEQNSHIPLFTLHSIVGKIIKSGETNRYYSSRFRGGSTFLNVKSAIQETTGHTYATREVYYHLRHHKNRCVDMKWVPNGELYLQKYQDLLNDGLDWEDSVETANWMLKQSPVSSLDRFPYSNIILVLPDVLNQDRNKTTRKFFNSWCEWIENYTNWNVYIVSRDHLRIYKLNQGRFFPLPSSAPNGALLSYIQ